MGSNQTRGFGRTQHRAPGLWSGRYGRRTPLVTDGKPSEDPIKLIQTMIHESHYELSRDIEKLMIEHENKLRQRIKSVLRQHAAGVVDLRITPLDQQKPLPAPEADS